MVLTIFRVNRSFLPAWANTAQVSKRAMKMKNLNLCITGLVTFTAFIILGYTLNLNELWKVALAGAAAGLSAVAVLRLLKR